MASLNLRIVVYYLLAFVFTIILGGLQQATGLEPLVSVPQWGPGIAALLMVLVFRKDGLRLSIFDRRLPASLYLSAALIPAAGGLVIALICRLMFVDVGLGDAADSLGPALLWMPVGAFGEELGWRGYLHKRLKMGLPAGLVTSIIVGVLWALWHIGLYGNGPLYMALLVLLMVSYSIVIYALVVEAGFNVIVAAVFHVVINLTNLLSFSVINELGFMAVSSLVWAAIAAVVLVRRRALFGG